MRSPLVAPFGPIAVPPAPKSQTRMKAAPRPAPQLTLDRPAYERLLPMVRRTAMRLVRKVPSHVTVGDLIGYGWVGLMEAFQRARPDMPAEEFEAYASYRVRGAMLDYLRTLDPATRDIRRASKRLTETIRALTAKHGEPPDEADIAKALELSMEDYHGLLERISQSGVARIDNLDVDQIDIPAETATLDDEIGRRELGGVVAMALETLPPKHRQIIALYYRDERTLREIGLVLGVTESRVCQLHSEAMHRIRAQVSEQGL